MRDPVFQALLQKRLPELVALERLIERLGERARIRVESQIRYDGYEFPVHSVVLGSPEPSAPALGIFAGVHGLERIGSGVALAWLHTITELLEWDESFKNRLQSSRLVFMPIINPVGLWLSRRSNGNGVDLMRNSPVQADEEPPFMVGGHRFSPKLPFYRGQVASASDMEVEARAVCEVVKRELFPANFSLSVDVHSGFGSVDRFWFPYAKSTLPPPHLTEFVALKRLFDRTYPHHVYRIEPQAAQYTTHGDLWDWLFDLKLAEKSSGLYLPWTLELGSWIWLKKNPLQFFLKGGVFNPLKPHRLQRILRRHLTLFDFLHRAVMNPEPWTRLDDSDQSQLLKRAKDRWYEKSRANRNQ